MRLCVYSLLTSSRSPLPPPPDPLTHSPARCGQVDADPVWVPDAGGALWIFPDFVVGPRLPAGAAPPLPGLHGEGYASQKGGWCGFLLRPKEEGGDLPLAGFHLSPEFSPYPRRCVGISARISCLWRHPANVLRLRLGRLCGAGTLAAPWPAARLHPSRPHPPSAAVIPGSFWGRLGWVGLG